MNKARFLGVFLALLLAGKCQGQSKGEGDTVPLAPGDAPPRTVVMEGFKAIPCIRPKESGVKAQELRRRVEATHTHLIPVPRAQDEKRDEFRITMECLELFRVNADWPRGAVSIEAALFPPIVYPPIVYPPRGLPEDESRDKQKEQTARRRVIWHWDVPAALRNGLMFPEAVGEGDSMSDGSEPFFPIHLFLHKPHQGDAASNLYFFDAKKGPLWRKDLLPLLDGHPKPLHVTRCATLRDSRRTVVVAVADDHAPDSGSRVIVFGPKGEVVSRTDIPGLYVYHVERNPSGNSLLLFSTIEFVGGKPCTGNPAGAYILIDGDGAMAGRFTHTNGSDVAQRVHVLNDDKRAVFIQAGLWFELP